MTTPRTVNEKDLKLILLKLKKIRNWSTRHKMDPWAFRQALLFVIRIDASEALNAGVKQELLDAFDKHVIEDTDGWIKNEKMKSNAKKLRM